MTRVQALQPEDVSLIARIDRSEHVETEYHVVDGVLVARPPSKPEIANWYRVGTGEHSVAAQIEFCASAVKAGAALFGAFDDDVAIALVGVNPKFENDLAWFAFFYVDRAYRRRGVGDELWTAAVAHVRAGGATRMYISASPTGSAVGFYLKHGCQLADPVHPALFANEPDDIHLIYSLTDQDGL